MGSAETCLQQQRSFGSRVSPQHTHGPPDSFWKGTVPRLLRCKRFLLDLHTVCFPALLRGQVACGSRSSQVPGSCGRGPPARENVGRGVLRANMAIEILRNGHRRTKTRQTQTDSDRQRQTRTENLMWITSIKTILVQERETLFGTVWSSLCRQVLVRTFMEAFLVEACDVLMRAWWLWKTPHQRRQDDTPGTIHRTTGIGSGGNGGNTDDRTPGDDGR